MRLERGRAILPAFLVAAGCLFVCSCGLPSAYSSLDAPIAPNSSDVGSNIFSFQNTPPSNPDFTLLGFELYYKFYDNTQNLGGTSYNTEAAQFAASTNPLPGTSALTALGYRPLWAAPTSPPYEYGDGSPYVPSQHSPPLFPIDSAERQTTFQASIDFTPTNTTGEYIYPSISTSYSSDTGIAIARYVTALSGATAPSGYLTTQPGPELRGFGSQDFTQYDNDLPAVLQISGTTPSPYVSPAVADGSATLGLFVLAYGLDQNLNTIYSVPVALGSIPINHLLLSSTWE